MKKITPTILALSFALANSVLAATGPKTTWQYGTDPDQVLDSYSPPGSDHPILIYTHGGSWFTGSKDNNVDNKKEGLIGNNDYVLVSVEYRKPSTSNPTSLPWQDQVQDVADAIIWVKNNAGSIGGSASKIFLMGHSAGAHLTMLVASDPSYGAHGIPIGLVGLDSGDYDVVDAYNGCSGSKCDKYAFFDNYNVTSMSQASPVNHANNRVIAPTILIRRNTTAKINQANFMDNAIDAGGQSNVEIHGTNDSHSAINQNIGAAGFSYTTQVSSFLDDLLGSSGTVLLEDGFEQFNAEGWNTDASLNSNKVNSGSYSLMCGSNDNYITSRNVDTSNASSLTVSLFYRDHNIDNNDDVFLQAYNGSNYINLVELGTSGPNNTWTQYTITTDPATQPNFFRTNFSIKIECSGIDSSENLRIDDVLITTN